MPRPLKAIRVAPFIQLTTDHFSNAWTLLLTVPFTSTPTAGHLNLAQHGGPMPPILSLIEKGYQDHFLLGVPDFLKYSVMHGTVSPSPHKILY